MKFSIEEGDIGFDLGRTKTALAEWLVWRGVVSGDTSDLVSQRRRMRGDNASLDQCVALSILKAHLESHGSRGASSADANASRCRADPCPTFAVSQALLALLRHEAERAGPRVELAESVRELATQVANISTERLTDALTELHAQLERYRDILQGGEATNVVISPSADSFLAFAFDRCLREAGALPADVPPPVNVSPLDVLVPGLCGDDIVALVQVLDAAYALGKRLAFKMDVLAPLPVVPAKGRGRATYYLLHQLRWQLQRGGLTIPEIARLVLYKDLDLTTQHEEAVQRTKQGLRLMHKRGFSWDPSARAAQQAAEFEQE